MANTDASAPASAAPRKALDAAADDTPLPATDREGPALPRQRPSSVRVDRASDRPLFRQIADILGDAVRSGHYQPGAKLPSESELMQRYRTSRLTVRRALGVLSAEEGLIEKVKGVGTFVRAPAAPVRVRRSTMQRDYWRRGRTALESGIFNSGDDASETVRIAQDVYRLEEVPAPTAVAEALDIAAGAPVFVRGRYLGDEDGPMQLADSYFPRDLAVGAIRDPEAKGVTYLTIESQGYRIDMFRERLRARMPTQDEARDLQIRDAGMPIIELTKTTFAVPPDSIDARSVPVEYFRAVMVGDRHEFEYDIPVTDAATDHPPDRQPVED